MMLRQRMGRTRPANPARARPPLHIKDPTIELMPDPVGPRPELYCRFALPEDDNYRCERTSKGAGSTRKRKANWKVEFVALPCPRSSRSSS